MEPDTTRPRAVPRGCIVSLILLLLLALAGRLGGVDRLTSWIMAREARRNAPLGYTHENYFETRGRADAIIAALEEYRRRHPEYPATLEHLVPEFLPAIEHPLVGKGRWEYKREAADRYWLSFFVGPTYEGDSYQSDTREWYVDR